MKKILLSILLVALVAAGCNKNLTPTQMLQDNNQQRAYALLNQLLVQYSPQTNLNSFAIRGILPSSSGKKNIVEFGPQNSNAVTGLYSVTDQALNSDYIIAGDGMGSVKISDVSWHSEDYATYNIIDSSSGSVITKAVLYAYDQPRPEKAFTRLFAGNSTLDVYDGYQSVSGSFAVDKKNSNICFTPDSQSAKKLPQGSHGLFCFSNYAQALQLLHVPDSAMKNAKVCSISAKASGFLEGYLLATSQNGQDYARLDRVTSIGNLDLQNCR